MVKVIYEDNHLLVVEKPVNILSQGDDTNDKGSEESNEELTVDEELAITVETSFTEEDLKTIQVLPDL